MIQKFLFKPLDKLTISQHFGENTACALKGDNKVFFCDGFNPPKGAESLYKRFGMTAHNGTDMPATQYTPIYCSQDGIVDEICSEVSRGLGIGMITKRKFYCDETGKEEYFKIRYWHNLANYVKVGDEVTVGQVIGLVGNTGYSSGPHIHFELKPVKVTFKDGKIRKVTNILQTNGYFGAVNAMPYMQDINASDFTKYKSWQERLTFAVLKYLK